MWSECILIYFFQSGRTENKTHVSAINWASAFESSLSDLASIMIGIKIKLHHLRYGP